MIAASRMPMTGPDEIAEEQDLERHQQVRPVERPEIVIERLSDLARRRKGIRRHIEDPDDQLEIRR